MKISQCTFCLLFTCLSLPLAQAATYRLIGEYYLDIGNQWTYQVHTTLEDNVPVDKWDTQTDTITGTKNILGHLTKIEEITDSNGTGYEYYELTNDYLLDYGYDDYVLGMHATVINNNPWEVVPVWINTTDNNRLLGTGDYQFQLDSPSMNWTGTMTSYITYDSQEIVTVPAGTFDCIVVISRVVFSDELGFQMEGTATSYADPEVGIIKEEYSFWMYNPYDGQTYYNEYVSNLTSFTYGNPAPQISSVTANPSTILDEQTSQLKVKVTDSSPLSYNWTIQPGEGTLDDYNSAEPVYTPPDITGRDQTFSIALEVSDGSKTSSSSVDVTVIDVNSITCDFYKDWYVDFSDFAVLASYWIDAECADPNWCQGTDLDHSGSTDNLELSIFLDRWLSEVNDLDLLAYWPMDDNNSTTLTSDISGNSHNGTASANTESLSAPGIIDTCFDLAGTDAVEISDNDSLSFTNDTADSPFSISAWVCVEAASGSYQMILTKFDGTTGSTDREWRFYLGLGALVLNQYDENTKARAAIQTINALSNGWHHVVYTYDGTGGTSAADGMNFYIDNILQIDVTRSVLEGYTAMRDGSTKIVIGAEYGSAGTLTDFWADKIDDVMLFSKCLTATEISALYSESVIVW